MGFRTRPGPRVEVIVVCLRSELLDEAVCSLSKTPESSEGDGREVARSMSFGVFDGGTIKESANGGCALEFTLDTPSMLLLKVAHGK